MIGRLADLLGLAFGRVIGLKYWLPEWPIMVGLWVVCLVDGLIHRFIGSSSK